MFEPLPNKHTLQTKNENEILVRYGGTIGGQFYGYTTYKIDIKTSNTLLKIIPKKYRQDFEPALISINIENVIPHTDTSIKAVINFYGDIYVLDVKQIHSVKCKPNAIRTAYCLKSYIHSYDDVLKIVKGTYEKDRT